MLRITWYGKAIVEARPPCEPVYAPALDDVVACGALEVRHVDAGGRMRELVLDEEEKPLRVPVDMEPAYIGQKLPGPGRYAVVARDRSGRHLARNDIYAEEDGHPGPWRKPTVIERMKAELVEAREAQRQAERKAREAEARALQAEAQVCALRSERDRYKLDLEAERQLYTRSRDKAATEHKRRLEAERALATEKRRRVEHGRTRITQQDVQRLTECIAAVAGGYRLLQKHLGPAEDRSRPSDDASGGRDGPGDESPPPTGPARSPPTGPARSPPPDIQPPMAHRRRRC